MASMPLHQARACCAGVESCSQPALAYGGESDGTRPSTRSMIQNGLPNHAGSPSNQSIFGIGTSEPSLSACMTRNCDSKLVSKNTWYCCGAMRTTSRWVSGDPSPSAHVASNSTVSLENPVAAGISIAPTHTSSSPATRLSQPVSWAAVSSGSRARAPTAGHATPEPESPEIARGPNPRQD